MEAKGEKTEQTGGTEVPHLHGSRQARRREQTGLATKIRLKRTGAKKQPQYRVIVIDERAPRDGRAIEEIGHHNPLTDPPTTVINEERARH